MSYRGPQAERQRAQADDTIYRYAGQPVVWRQYVSVSAGTPQGGLGDSGQYRSQTITALLNFPRLTEVDMPVGPYVSGMLMVTTREKLGRSDLLVWRGDTYRVYSDPVPSPLTSSYQTVLQRGQSS
jgi:hypothetical protein